MSDGSHSDAAPRPAPGNLDEEVAELRERVAGLSARLDATQAQLEHRTAQLEDAEALLSGIQQSVDFPLMVVDASRRIVQANAACRALTTRELSLIHI